VCNRKNDWYIKNDGAFLKKNQHCVLRTTEERPSSLRGPEARIWPKIVGKKSCLGDRTKFQSVAARGGEEWRRNV